MQLQFAGARSDTAASDSPDLLARIGFCARPAAEPWLMPLPLLDSADLQEYWQTGESVASCTASGKNWRLHHRFTATLAMSWLAFELSDHGGTSAATRWAYETLFRHLTDSDHRHLLKIWHYLPGINLGEGDAECYRQFCVGREQALRVMEYARPLPAATAIGIPVDSGPAVFYWLSGRREPVNIENPRQTSAWRYPPEYGPASPSFSRASQVELPGGRDLLLISGTASVTGHESAHPGETAPQTDEMLRNLTSLISAAGMQFAPHRMWLRVYLRQPRDWPLVRNKMLAAGLDGERLLALHGDICRRELMVELDGCLLQQIQADR